MEFAIEDVGSSYSVAGFEPGDRSAPPPQGANLRLEVVSASFEGLRPSDQHHAHACVRARVRACMHAYFACVHMHACVHA